jgi:periplasmic protein TonB
MNILLRNRRYPPSAQSEGEQGVTLVAFTINRQGKVTSARIARSSGSAALDEETLALVHRVPIPPPPAEMIVDPQFTLEVRYTLVRYPCSMLGISTGADCL